jgi:Uncharacterized protein conserved in archaea
MAHRIVLSCTCASADVARIIAEAVRPEVGAVDDARSETVLEQDAGTVTVRIDAEDLTALRAAMNSWSRLVSTARAVLG